MRSGNSHIGAPTAEDAKRRQSARGCGLWLGLSLLVMQACTTFDEGGPARPVTENSCTSDDDCDGSARCENLICVADAMETSQSVWLKLKPPTSTAGAETTISFRQVSLKSSKNANITLREPLAIEAFMEREDVGVAGTMQFIMDPEVPAQLDTTLRSMVSVNEGSMEPSTLALVPEEAYSVYAIPAEQHLADLPPLSKRIKVDEQTKVSFDYDQEFTERTYLVSGLREGVAFEAYAKLADDSGRRISTRATVTNGQFSLKFGQDEQDYRIELRPQNEAISSSDLDGDLICTNQRLLQSTMPTFSVDPRKLSQDDADNYLIQLPQLPNAIEYEGPVRLCAGTADLAESLNRPLSISVRSKQLDLAASGSAVESTASGAQAVTMRYNRETVTTYDGDSLKYCLAVMPGVYEVVVVPPVVSDQCGPGEDAESCGCGLFAQELIFRAPEGQNYGRGFEVALPGMASLSGDLLAMDGSPIAGAAIEASPQSTSVGVATEGSELAEFSRYRDTMSADDGGFRLPLDVGAYDVTIKPPTDTGFPWMVVQDVLVANRSQEFVKDLVMESPLSISGTLSYQSDEDDAGGALAGTLIQAFVIVEDSQAPNEQRAIEIGETTVDDQGTYTLLLPPTQQHGWFE